MPSLGDEFRAAREARHLSLSDVSEQLHIRSVYLQSIEDEDWASIAAPVYVRGFVRTYARFLGLDPEEAAARYEELIGYTPRVTSVASYPSGQVTRTSGPSIWVWLAGGAALALVAFVAYNYIQFRQSTGATAQVGTRSPVPRPSAPETAPPTDLPPPVPKPAHAGSPAVGMLVVRSRQDSWLQVTVDGVEKFKAVLPAGAEKVYRGKTATIRAGNAGGLDLLVNGKDVGSLGAAGDVVERSFRLAKK